MELTWISVVDTTVKIGLGALISCLATYLSLVKSQSYEDKKEVRIHFYKLQEEKKSKYVELLTQSQVLIQSHLYSSCSPDSDAIKRYLRAFNEVQIISNDTIRLAAFNMMTEVQSFILINKNRFCDDLPDNMIASARERISIFQKIAQDEVTRCYREK